MFGGWKKNIWKTEDAKIEDGYTLNIFCTRYKIRSHFSCTSKTFSDQKRSPSSLLNTVSLPFRFWKTMTMAEQLTGGEPVLSCTR